MKFGKILPVLLSLALMCGFFALVGVAGGDTNLSLTASVSGKTMNLTLKNNAPTYLGNIKVSITTPDGVVLNVGADGKVTKAAGTAADSVRELSPGESKDFAANMGSYASVATTVTTPKPVTTTQKPVTTTQKPVTTTTTADAPVIQTTPGEQTTTPDPDTAGTETVIPSEETGTETDTEAVEDTVHSIAPEEETTITADLDSAEETEAVIGADTDTDGTADGDVTEEAEKGDNTTLAAVICSVAAALVIGAGVVVGIILKKKRGVSSVIVLAILLSGMGAAGALEADAAAEVYVATETVSTDAGEYTVSVTYKLVPAAVVNNLKNMRRPPAGDDCNSPKVDVRRLIENAGPLGDYRIYIGEHDFWFLGDDVDLYSGNGAEIKDTRLNKLSKMMSDRDAWAKENGIKLYFVIAPNKSTVYSDYVPDKITAADRTITDVVIDHLRENSTVEVIDLRQPLIDARATYGDDLYYNYDTHWNHNGGFVGYSAIIDRVAQDFPGVNILSANDYAVEEQETYMKDLPYYLGYYSEYTDYGPMYTLKSGMTATIGAKRDDGYWGQFRFCSRWKDGYTDALQYVEYDSEYNDGAPNLYMCRDSYSLSLIHFLKDSFDRSVFNWTYDFDRTEILNSGADVVIIECVEGHLMEVISSRTFIN